MSPNSSLRGIIIAVAFLEGVSSSRRSTPPPPPPRYQAGSHIPRSILRIGRESSEENRRAGHRISARLTERAVSQSQEVLLSLRSLPPYSRGHLCYPRYNPTITGECCPRANPGPRVTNHRGPWGPSYPTRDSLQSRTEQDLTSLCLSSSVSPVLLFVRPQTIPFFSLTLAISPSLKNPPFPLLLLTFYFSASLPFPPFLFLPAATPRPSLGSSSYLFFFYETTTRGKGAKRGKIVAR